MFECEKQRFQGCEEWIGERGILREREALIYTREREFEEICFTHTFPTDQLSLFFSFIFKTDLSLMQSFFFYLSLCALISLLFSFNVL
jgi:hypothetical protein